jgi:hypothetical protein
VYRGKGIVQGYNRFSVSKVAQCYRSSTEVYGFRISTGVNGYRYTEVQVYRSSTGLLGYMNSTGIQWVQE